MAGYEKRRRPLVTMWEEKVIPFPAPCNQDRVYVHRVTPRWRECQSQAVCQFGPACGSNTTQNSVVVLAIGVPVQSSTDPGKPVHSFSKHLSAPLWEWLSTGALGALSLHNPQPLSGKEHWVFRNPLTSPQLWLPRIPPQAAPELLSGSPQLCFQVVSPLGTFKRSLINSSCADKSVFSAGWNLHQLTEVVTTLTQALHPLSRQRWAWPWEYLHWFTLQCLEHVQSQWPWFCQDTPGVPLAFEQGQEALSQVVSHHGLFWHPWDHPKQQFACSHPTEEASSEAAFPCQLASMPRNVPRHTGFTSRHVASEEEIQTELWVYLAPTEFGLGLWKKSVLLLWKCSGLTRSMELWEEKEAGSKVHFYQGSETGQWYDRSLWYCCTCISV